MVKEQTKVDKRVSSVSAEKKVGSADMESDAAGASENEDGVDEKKVAPKDPRKYKKKFVAAIIPKTVAKSEYSSLGEARKRAVDVEIRSGCTSVLAGILQRDDPDDYRKILGQVYRFTTDGRAIQSRIATLVKEFLTGPAPNQPLAVLLGAILIACPFREVEVDKHVSQKRLTLEEMQELLGMSLTPLILINSMHDSVKDSFCL